MDRLKIIVLHGLFMWLGTGLCMLLGIILIRFLKITRRQEGNNNIALISGRIARGHIVVQSVGLLLALVGGGLAFGKLGPMGLAHTHGRLGVALLLASLLAAFLGVVRPEEGRGWKRGVWYAAHWVLGTGTIILVCVNIFIGLHVYELISASSVRPVKVVFSVQLAVMALVYLAQDRWAYLRQVQWALRPVTTSPSTTSPTTVTSIAAQSDVHEAGAGAAVSSASKLASINSCCASSS